MTAGSDPDHCVFFGTEVFQTQFFAYTSVWSGSVLQLSEIFQAEHAHAQIYISLLESIREI